LAGLAGAETQAETGCGGQGGVGEEEEGEGEEAGGEEIGV